MGDVVLLLLLSSSLSFLLSLSDIADMIRLNSTEHTTQLKLKAKAIKNKAKVHI